MKSYKFFGNLAGGVLFLVIFFSLMGCASAAGARSLTVTDGMKSVISSYANDFAFEYPNELNVAHLVRGDCGDPSEARCVWGGVDG
jgi:hypothetical protein